MPVKQHETGIGCRLCGGQAEELFSATVLARHTARYFKCRDCCLVQTEEPFWLEEAYNDAISAADTGIVARNLYLMKVVAVLLRIYRMASGTYLDYGGGHGLFTRIMRDHGYDFRWYDLHAENLFARGFELEGETKVKGITAFEVLEHLQHPCEFFADVLGRRSPEIFIASTEAYADPLEPSWHYFYYSTGQHIAFYHQQTLRWVAQQYGYSYEAAGGLHIFTARGRRLPAVRWIARLARFIYPCFRFSSLVAADHEKMVARMQGGKNVRGK